MTSPNVSIAGWSLDHAQIAEALGAGNMTLWEMDVATGDIKSTRDLNSLLGLSGSIGVSLGDLWNKLVESGQKAADISQDAEGPTSRQATMEIGLPDGDRKVVHLRFDVIRGDHGAITRVVGIAINASEALAAVTPEDRRFRQLADMAPAIIWVGTSAVGDLQFVNRRWCDYTGQTEAEALPHGWQHVITPEDFSVVQQHARIARERNRGFSTEARLRRHDGELRWHSIVVEPRFSPEGEIVAWVGVNTDIHDHKKEGEILRFQRDQLFELARDAFGVFDRDGVLLSVNPAWTRILGWTRAELEGSNFLMLLHPDDVGKAMSELSGYENGNDQFAFETRVRSKTGVYRWISWTGVPSRSQFYAVGRDVTREKEAAASLHEAQEALRQSQKLEAIGLLTGSIAHDQNNAVTAISSGLSLAESRIKSNKIEEALHFIGIARTSARRAAALSHRLLAFARRQELDIRPVNLNDIVASLESLLIQSMGENVTVELSLANELALAAADPNMFENALINLAINARDAMPKGGTLRVETMNAILDERFVKDKEGLSPGNYVLICITDTGRGMSAEELSHVFEPFYTTKPYGEGTGLGLPMVYGFVKQLGGFISMRSEPGNGTTVKIYLPETKEIPATDEDSSQASPPMGQGETVLVVEDNPTVRKLTGDILEQVGYRVLLAEDARQGLEVVASSAQIDLLLSDIMMPGGMNGREMAARALVQRPGLPVLFVTGREDGPEVDVAGSQTIMKPYALFELASRVREVLDRKKASPRV